MKNVLFIEYIFYKCILITWNIRVENNFRIFLLYYTENVIYKRRKH